MKRAIIIRDERRNCLFLIQTVMISDSDCKRKKARKIFSITLAFILFSGLFPPLMMSEKLADGRKMLIKIYPVQK
jgi:hypothetical protein